MFSAADLADLYSADIADPVLFAGEPVPRFGQFSEAGQVEFGGELVTTEPSLRYPVALFPAMPRYTLLTVSGRTWKTRAAPRLLSDGREAVVALELQP